MAESNVIHPAELEIFANSLRSFEIEEIGSTNWLDNHEVLFKLNQQAILEAKEYREEIVKEHLILHEKLQVLVHEVFSIAIWRTKVLPAILEINDSPKTTFLLYSVLYHEAVAVSLLEIVLYHENGCAALGEYAIDLIDYCAQSITQLIGLVNIKHFSGERSVKELISETTVEEIERLKRDIFYKIGLRCITILSYISDKLPALHLSVTRRLVQTHDIPCLLSEVLHCQPWLRNVKGIEKFIDDKWTPVYGMDIKKVTKIEAQTWFCLRQLLFNVDAMKNYEINQFRQREISKCQALLSVQIIDQLPPLADLKHHLCTLSLSSGGKQHLSGILLEEVPKIREMLLYHARKIGFKNIAQQQIDNVFNIDNENIKEKAKRLSDIYGSNFFANMDDRDCNNEINDQGDNKQSYCTQCGVMAEKKCSRCEKSYYCSRECQVENWPVHKKICESNTSH